MLPLYNQHLGNYPTPTSINYFYGFGSASGIAFANQVLTGIILAGMYVPTLEAAPISIELIQREGFYGWYLKNSHANGASAIFAFMYLHMGRSLLIGSRGVWPWLTGVILFVLFILAAFLGYVLVWSQMSYWAATVITTLLTILPFGDQLLDMVWGGYCIDQPTLSRFFAWHYLIPLIIAALVIIHIIGVHYSGSSTPMFGNSCDKVSFMRYYSTKDGIGLALEGLIATVFICLLPVALADAELFEPVNTMSTPAHIVPEWYLLALYAILRCIPNKVGGFLLLLAIFVGLVLQCVKNPDFGEIFGEIFSPKLGRPNGRPKIFEKKI